MPVTPRSPWLRRLLACPPDHVPPALTSYRASAGAGLSLRSIARDAGYTPRALTRRIARGLAGHPLDGWTPARCLAAGRAALAQYGPSIRSSTAWESAHCRPSRKTVIQRFGSWPAFWALAAPDLPPVRRGRRPRSGTRHG